MSKINAFVDEQSLADKIISALKQCIDGEMTPEKLCLFLNVQPFYHESKKVLYNKLIFSEYSPGENSIHIYIGSIREHFSVHFYFQVIKALYHEIFHFLWSKRKERFSSLFLYIPTKLQPLTLVLSPEGRGKDEGAYSFFIRDTYMRSLQKINPELTASIFAEKLSNEVTR